MTKINEENSDSFEIRLYKLERRVKSIELKIKQLEEILSTKYSEKKTLL